MHSQTVRYARNGALTAIGLYLAITVPLLGLSMQHGSPVVSGAEPPMSSLTPQASR